MSYNSLFGNPMHPRTNIHNDAVKANLGTKLNNVRDRRHTQQEIPLFDIGNTITFTPVSAYGASLLDTTSLADLRATILENTNEEAIRLLADGNNEINFYTGGTGASNLRLQIKNSSVDLLNNTPLNVNDLNVGLNKSLVADYVGSRAGENLRLRRGGDVYQEFTSSQMNFNQNVVYADNKHLKQKIEDNDNRVLVESVAKRQYCLYSHEAGTNSGLLIQATPNNVMKLNNYRNSVSAYQPISINSTLLSYLVCGADINPTSINTANFISNGESVFSNGANPLLHISATNIQPYKNIIPSGSLDIGATATRFNNIYNNISTITNEIRMNTFAPVGSDYTQKGIFFREGYNGVLNGDNMCIRSIARTDPGPPVGTAGDRLLISSYGGLSVNYFTNNAGNDGSTGRIALFHDEITVHKNILPPDALGLLDIGSASKPFGIVYTTDLRAANTVYTADLEATVSIKAVGNNAYLSAEDDTSTNGKVQIVSENSSTYTGYVSFIKNDTRQMFLGYDNALQFENGSNFIIRSDAQTYLNFIHDANFANRKININVDLIPSSNSYDLGSFTERFAQIHGTTINASSQISTDLIAPYAGGISTSVQIDADFLPINPGGGGSGTRKLGNGSNLWSEVFASNATINTSDRNMKKDITPITDALQFVRKLKPVQYKWKENSHGRTHTGFIAQEVLEASPLKDNWAGYVDTGNGLGLRYAEFISINTSAIKELDAKLKIMAIKLNNTDGDVKVDLNYHTDSSEIIERLEILENRELTPIVEEYDDSELLEKVIQNEEQIKILKIENKKQEDCISQLIADNMNLTEKLKMLMERLDKFDETPNVGIKIEDNSDILLSENGPDHMEQIEERLHSVEQKVTKLSNKQTKLITAVNKLKK